MTSLFYKCFLHYFVDLNLNKLTKQVKSWNKIHMHFSLKVYFLFFHFMKISVTLLQLCFTTLKATKTNDTHLVIINIISVN